jgi:hypothetical protein
MYIIMEYIIHTWTEGLSMNKISDDAKVLKVFYRRKVITVDTLSSLLDSSVKTARRRLKLWEAYTSYNENGRYYTLPDIPEFDANGLWSYRSIRFSKYGNLKQTAIQLIRLSKAGVDAAEMAELLAIPVRSFLSAFQEHSGIRREKLQGRFVHFSAVDLEYNRQRNHRVSMTRITQLPRDTEAILILVEMIKNPRLNAEALSLKLTEKNCAVPARSISNLLAYPGLTVKKTPQVAS